jgi:hypothetical protein
MSLKAFGAVPVEQGALASLRREDEMNVDFGERLSHGW